MRASAITGPVAHHGEGAMWDARAGRLLSVDMLAGAVLALADDGSVTRHPVGSSVAAVVRPRAVGGYLVAIEHGFALFDDDFAPAERVDDVITNAAVRMNEGGCDPQGRFYCGSMAYAETPGAGSIYRLDPDLGVQTILTGVTISNGMQWSADGSTVFYIDTPERRVDAFDFDAESGTFSARRPFVHFGDEPGSPDGMAIDADGGLWVAMWGGSAVRHFDATGALIDVVDLPVTNITSCAFGGPDLGTLYITSSAEGLEPGAQPEAGSLFAVEPGARGVLLHPFGA